jgi:8-oxo-dGTP pyrophosphatase MutT (NUDIX family)
MRRDQGLKALIQKNLGSFQVQALVGDGQHAAAVALAVTETGHGANLSGLPESAIWETHAALILTRRSAKLRNHAGQWALPGGRIDAGESAEQAALRELSEEVNLCLEPDAVLGRLDDFVTRSGFVISPVVIWAGAARLMSANADEVQSIHRIALTEFERDDAPQLETLDGSEHPVLRMPVGTSWIAAPTAAFLYQFREVCLRGLDTRVAHYEQPTFAWK